MKRTINVTYYECPVCGKNSTNKQEIENHFRQHQIKTNRTIYCKICGAGWYVSAYGKKRAKELAEECYKRHIEAGNADETAARSFFLSKGAFGYVKIKESEGQQD